MQKLALVLLSALALNGCGVTKVDMYRGDAAHSGVYSGGVDALNRLEWKFNSKSAIKVPSVVSEGVAYFGNSSGYFFAIDFLFTDLL